MKTKRDLSETVDKLATVAEKHSNGLLPAEQQARLKAFQNVVARVRETHSNQATQRDRVEVSDSKKRGAAGQLAKIFEDHFASLPRAERIEREKAFDRAITQIGSRAKSSERSKPRGSRRVSRRLA